MILSMVAVAILVAILMGWIAHYGAKATHAKKASAATTAEATEAPVTPPTPRSTAPVTPSTSTALRDWKQIALKVAKAVILVIGAIIIVRLLHGMGVSNVLPAAWRESIESLTTSDLFWIMVIIGLVLLARAVPTEVKGVFYGLAVLVGMGWVYINFSPGIDSGFGWIKRCVNAECSAEATDYQRYNGGVLRLDSGEQETVRLTGKEVRVPNLTCHQPVIDPVPDVRWDAGYENFFIKPLPGLLEQVVTVSIVPSAESYACKQFWRGRPLHS